MRYALIISFSVIIYSCTQQKLKSENDLLKIKIDSLKQTTINFQKMADEEKTKAEAMAKSAFEESKKYQKLATCSAPENHLKLLNELEAAQKAAERNREEAMAAAQEAKRQANLAELAIREAEKQATFAQEQAALARITEEKAQKALADCRQ